jgi:phosphoribosylformylglycinamidine cyclo-ligase
MKLSYRRSGVDYNLLDPAKRLGQKAGIGTAYILNKTGYREVEESRGETAYLIEGPECYYALVEEGLGTKNLVADETGKITGKTYYDVVAYDTVAAIINDLITVGAKPLTVLAYWAVGDSAWMKDEKRMKDLVYGWKKACLDSKATWGGGETPSMNDIVFKETINLAGAGFGVIKPKNKLILGEKIRVGDVIVMFESNGIHANGLSLARKITSKTERGYASKLPSGKIYGEALLVPTIIYAKLIQNLFRNNIEIHYMANITGHGWRKIMRANRNFTYLIERLPYIPEVFHFIQQKSNLSDQEMYATFNMGAGFAIYVPKKDAENVVEIARKNKIKAWIAGRVEKGEKQVIIKPKNICYKENDLKIR